MATTHPDFSIIQQRLRRLNPAWYPEKLAIDDVYGAGMAFGIDAALDKLEAAAGLPEMLAPSPMRRSPVPTQFRFLIEDPIAPLMVRLAIDELGTIETRGGGNTAKIIAWADEVAEIVGTPYARWAADWYNQDSIPWCGLFMAVIAARASQGRRERFPPTKYLAALEWASFGHGVPKHEAQVGDVIVLTRSGGGHVTLCVGTETGGRRLFGLGGNQSDAVNIMPFDLSRVHSIRRPAYMVAPAGARVVVVGPGGASSSNEA